MTLAATPLVALFFADRVNGPFGALGGLISGHAIKHMLTAGAVAVVAVMLRRTGAAPLTQR